MWKRKTEEDYKKEKKVKEKEKIFFGLSKQDILTSFFIAVFLTLSVSYYVQTISLIIFCFVLFFVLSCIGVLSYGDPAFIFKIIFSGSSSSNVSVICNVCHSVVLKSNNKICECGGRYEPLENWKWIEDEIEESEQAT